MKEVGFADYLQLLGEIGNTLEQLSQVEREKTVAVRQDDLAALDRHMKREQALGMALRGYDRRRQELLSALGMDDVPLSGLQTRSPEHLRLQAKEVEERLRRQFQLFQGASDVARTTLECNLHEVEKSISALGGEGAEQPQPEAPNRMKTDFRA